MCPIATDDNIAEINDLARTNLRAPEIVHTEFGSRSVWVTPIGDAAAKLRDANNDHYQNVVDAIKNCTPQGPKKDAGKVIVDGMHYCWWFKYWDSTEHFHMPNGHRELIIAFEREVEED